MITPTKTVCYAQVEHSKSWHKVIAADNCGLTVEWSGRISAATWSYSFFSRVIVREESICLSDLLVIEHSNSHWHGGVLEEVCSKTFFPNSPCLCRGCNPMIGQSL